MATTFDRSSILRLIAGLALAVLCLGVGTPVSASSEIIEAVSVQATALEAASVAAQPTTRCRSIMRRRAVRHPSGVGLAAAWRRWLRVRLLPPTSQSLLPPWRRGPPALLM